MMLHYLSPATNVMEEPYFPRRNIASSDKLYACALVVGALDCAISSFKDDDVPGLVQISLRANTAPAFRYLLPAKDALILRVASWYRS